MKLLHNGWILWIVEEKIFEADFFLEKLKDCKGTQLREARFNLSAFITAARSVTFTLQKSLSGVDGFDAWYEQQRERMKNNKLSSFFLNARNLAQKVGHYHINGSSIEGGKNEFLFIDFTKSYDYIPEEDIVTAAQKHLTFLTEIIYDCFKKFGDIIDPDKYYSKEALGKRGQTVKDVELEVWGYTKWTGMGMSEDESLHYILQHMVKSPMDELFIKYLRKTKDDW